MKRVERWEHLVANDPNFDPDLWFLAMDGDRIVGISLCMPQLGDEKSIGVVGTLGVVREWRHRGLGMALLLHSFHELRRRGRALATLSVDANSLTGATRSLRAGGDARLPADDDVRVGAQTGRGTRYAVTDVKEDPR